MFENLIEFLIASVAVFFPGVRAELIELAIYGLLVLKGFLALIVARFKAAN